MRVAEIWRYPVKSMLGEKLSEVALDAGGPRGDRCWGVRDEATGKVLTGRREPQLLLATASLAADGEPDIALPSGLTCHGTGAETDAVLSQWLQRPVTLAGAEGAPPGEAEAFVDATDDTSDMVSWSMPQDRFVDAMPLLLVTTASLRAGASLYPEGEWDARRFRPNLLIEADGDGWLEDSWCGHTLQVGSVQVLPKQGCARCTMVTRPQPDLNRDIDIFKTLARHHGATFGVWAVVESEGTVNVDDEVSVSAAS